MVTLPAWSRDYTPYRWSDGQMPTKPRKEGPRRGVPGVGKRIREARKRKGLTIRALAELTGVGAGSLTFWELANRDLFVGDFLKLTAALKVPPESLLPDALPLPPEVFAASFECPGCHMEAGVLMTAMSPPRKPIQDRTNGRTG
jgi:transcriptional regulator with XRE-family HTH domain